MSREKIEAVTLPALGQLEGIDHFFGTRWIDFPLAAARYLGVGEDKAVTIKQIHGDDIMVVEATGSKPDRGFDAMITNHPEILLLISTADCVPILMVDPGRKVIAAVHAGWRGSLKGITIKVIHEMTERFGSDPREIQIGIGPSAGRCCYEVGEMVLAPLQGQFHEWRRVTKDHGNGRALLDLRHYNKIKIMEAGVPEDQIYQREDCTICSPGLFYSYRRDGSRKKTMYSGIMLREP